MTTDRLIIKRCVRNTKQDCIDGIVLHEPLTYMAVAHDVAQKMFIVNAFMKLSRRIRSDLRGKYETSAYYNVIDSFL